MAKVKTHKEYSKGIVDWAKWIASISLTVFLGGYYWLEKDPPESIVALVGTIVTGVIIAYSAKATIENNQKIKNSSECSEDGGER